MKKSGQLARIGNNHVFLMLKAFAKATVVNAVAIEANNEGKRAENSETPKMNMETAAAQVDKGGFAKNGVFKSICGMSQKPCVKVSLAISPYLASVVSASGRIDIKNNL